MRWKWGKIEGKWGENKRKRENGGKWGSGGQKGWENWGKIKGEKRKGNGGEVMGSAGRHWGGKWEI